MVTPKASLSGTLAGRVIPKIPAATFHGPNKTNPTLATLPPGVHHDPSHVSIGSNNWGVKHGHQPIVYFHAGHRWHRWYYLAPAAVGIGTYWYWYDTPADADYIDTDTDPSAVAALDRPDDTLPDCDPDDDTCTNPAAALENAD